MSWFEKRRWSRQRAEEERQALAASVEELTARGEEQGMAWDGEEEEERSEGMSGPAVIPPKLHLQSRPLPVVRLEVTKHGPVRGEAAREKREHREERESQGERREERGMEQEGGGLRVLTEPARGAARRLGRSTRVRLQAVLPGQESALEQEPTTERVPVFEKEEEGRAARAGASVQKGAQERELPKLAQRLARRIEPAERETSDSAPRALLCGSGVIEEGQEDATIHNTRISAQSVVTVMLAGNPGPVVVHYVSLQPRAGFTLHMSAPVSARTPFTYAVWLF